MMRGRGWLMTLCMRTPRCDAHLAPQAGSHMQSACCCPPSLPQAGELHKLLDPCTLRRPRSIAGTGSVNLAAEVCSWED